jgi:hypothetical protein
MARKPWFRKQRLGAGWVPATPQGYAVLIGWLAAVLATAWVPASVRPPILIGLGVAYFAGSFWLSQP